MIVAAVILGFVALILLLIKVSRVGKREHYLPPGPPTLPLLGNLHILPTEFSHHKFTEWARRYGPIYSLKIGPGTAVVITSVKAVKELLDKRSATTSDRPPTYVGDVVTGGFNMGIGRYADNWRASRKACQAILTAQVNINAYLPIQKAEATQLLYDILKTPEDFFHHIHRYAHSTMLTIVYGVRSPRYNSPVTTAFSHVQRMWLEFLAPGAPPLVDLLPFLKHIPEGWPGASWKRVAKEIRKLQRELYFGLMDSCEDRIRKGDEDNGYFMEKIVKTPEQFGMTRELSGYLGGVLMDAGTDTTASVLHSIVLMLAAFPEAQKKAQEEMDRVVGSERIPTPDDWKELPYTQALIKEVNRFRPAAPLALPHASTADENLEGYIVPKGSILFMNTWGIFHDPELFENPETFDPDRYLTSEYGTKPGVDDRDFRHTLAFGAGRRICPGIHVANTSFMLFAMYCIWAFDCGPSIDPETKKPIPVDIWAYMKGLVTGPKPFKCSITIRSPQRVEIIEREFVDSIDTFLPFELYLCEEDKTWVAKTRDTLLAH